MRIGTLMQPVITQVYEERTGYRVEPVTTIRHPRHSFMLANIDGRIANAEGRILEVKNTSIRHGWGEEGTSEVPIYVRLQCEHYLIVTPAEVCDVAVLIAGGDFRIYTIRHDAARAAELIEAEREFWGLVRRREPPEPYNLDDVLARWGGLDVVGEVPAGPAEIAAVENLRDLRRVRKELDMSEESNKEIVLAALADKGDTLVDHGEVLATWRLDSGRKAYAVEAREPARRLVIK